MAKVVEIIFLLNPGNSQSPNTLVFAVYLKQVFPSNLGRESPNHYTRIFSTETERVMMVCSLNAGPQKVTRIFISILDAAIHNKNTVR